MEVPDEVRRELEIGASRERVWAALTEPEQLVQWFPTKRAEIELRPGGPAALEWEEARADAVVDVVEEISDGASTRVLLVESGFASLPDQIEQRSQKGNDEGWAHELQELKEYLEAA